MVKQKLSHPAYWQTIASIQNQGAQCWFLHICDDWVGCLADDVLPYTSTVSRGLSVKAIRSRPIEAGAMRHKTGTLVKLALTVVLAMGMLLASNSRIMSHDLPELSQIVADHQREVANNGFGNHDIVDVVHTYHGHDHNHDVSDHDHNVAFLPTPASTGFVEPTRVIWVTASYALPGCRTFDLHRPPRG